jgi:hypothetical protein
MPNNAAAGALRDVADELEQTWGGRVPPETVTVDDVVLWLRTRAETLAAKSPGTPS